MEKSFKKPSVYIPLAMLCCLLWSSAFPAIKRGYFYFEITAQDYPAQILFAGCRFFAAGILTILISSIIFKQPLYPKRKSTFARIFALALVQTALNYSFFYLALALIDGSAGSVINASGSFFSVLLAAVFFKSDRLNGNKIIGCILGFSGIVLLNIKTLRFGGGLGGEGLMLLSALFYALSSVMIKKFSQQDHPALLNGWQFVLGGLMMIVTGVLLGGRLRTANIKAVLVLVYLALVSAVAYTLWSMLLKYNEVSKISVFGFINPVGGVILSALLLHEKVDIVFSIISLALVSLGIVIVNRRNSDLAKLNQNLSG